MESLADVELAEVQEQSAACLRILTVIQLVDTSIQDVPIQFNLQIMLHEF